MDLSKGGAGNINPERCWHCPDCDWVSAYPRRVCPECGVVNGEWVQPLSPMFTRVANAASSPSHSTGISQRDFRDHGPPTPSASYTVYTAYTQEDTLQEREVSHPQEPLLKRRTSSPRKDAGTFRQPYIAYDQSELFIQDTMRVRGREPSPRGRIPLQDDPDQKDDISIAPTTQEPSSRRNGQLQDESAQEDMKSVLSTSRERSPRRLNPLQNEPEQAPSMLTASISQSYWQESPLREENYQKVSTSKTSIEWSSQELTPQREVPSQDAFEQEDSMSVASTSQESVFSLASRETSATVLSKESGFSIEQIQNATQLFVTILQNDELLAPLYGPARNDTRIGPDRLRRHIRGAIKTFSEQLKEEANDYLQHAASRLVEAKAHHTARCIARGEDAPYRLPESGEPLDLTSNDLEDSSEEETAERSVEHTGLEDLQAFRLFLTDSDAYTTLQADIHAFCTKHANAPSNRPAIERPECVNPSRTVSMHRWKAWQERVEIMAHCLFLSPNCIYLARFMLILLADVCFPLTDDLLIILGCLEPPLRAGWTRIRSDCCCGDHVFDDFKELRTGGVAALVREMRQSSVHAKITVTPYHPGIMAQKYTARMPTWFRHIGHALLSILRWRKPNLPGLVQYNPGSTANTTNTINPGIPMQQLDTVHLMSCVHRTRDDPILLQIDVRGIATDRALFQLLKTQVLQRHNRLYRTVSCRSIVGIHFTKFLLETGGSVEIREHNASCDSVFSTTNYSYCDCLPPQDIVEPFPNAEYRCDLPCPPQIWPPIGPTKLLHKLKCPESNPQGYTWVLNRVPRRVAGELSGAGDQAAPGWGLYFQEGWDFYVFTSIICFLFLLGSLIFAVCWWVLKHDIQGAFSVSAYMVTACGLFVAFVVSKTG